jgi:hypothetical protein
MIALHRILHSVYQRNPKIYTLASHHLTPTPPPSSSANGSQTHTHLAHVAAHISDLVSFRKACPGVRTVYVRRPTEEPSVQGKVTERREGTEEYGEFEVDMVVDGIDELARRLG